MQFQWNLQSLSCIVKGTLRNEFPYWLVIVKVSLSSGYQSSRMVMFTIADVSLGWRVIVVSETVKSSLEPAGIEHKTGVLACIV